MIPFKAPSLPEQKKIADFLGALDDHIELQEKKLSLLKEQKRGYLQRIFA
jgi:type I restriction enzyme S subunit